MMALLTTYCICIYIICIFILIDDGDVDDDVSTLVRQKRAGCESTHYLVFTWYQVI